MHWDPETFWQATMHELLAASDGHKKFNTPPKDEPMNRSEYEDLKKKLDQSD